MKRKILGLLLTGAMVLSLAACGSKSASTEGDKVETGSSSSASVASKVEEASEAAADEAKPVDGGQIIIGDGTQSNGDIYPYWSNASSDFMVYKFTFGAATVDVNQRGEFILDPTVVKDMQKVENADGSATYTFKLHEDLKWSNGEKITAKDYVFHTLYFSSKEIVEIGSQDNAAGAKYVGYADFSTGKAKKFSGVRLLGEYEFSLQVADEYVPHYYDLALVQAAPSYMKDWVPESIDVADDGDGAYFKGDFSVATIKPLQDEGRRFNLSVYSGPYMKEKYDETSNTYTLKRNPEFKGTFDGQKPHIETVIYKLVKSETQIDELATGGVDVLVKLGGGTEINAGLDLVDKGSHSKVSYPRNGYGKLSFKCDRGPTQFAEVRHAVAYLLDRNDFAKTFTGGHGSVVNGAYGLSQWMVEDREEEIATLNQYSYSLDNAVAELEKGGWVLDKDGKEYKEGIRYKKTDEGKLMPLVIEWCSSENNPVSDLLATKLANSPDVKKAGMEIKQSTVTFSELLNNLYDQKENNFNMYNLGAGFTAIYDLEETYKVGGPQNDNKISDEELAKFAKEMNAVDSKDTEKYLDNFVAFQKRWNEMLPDIPLYSNEFHDFFSSRLKGYEGIKDALWDISSQLLYSWVED